jgi:hypothetical protein
MSAQFKVRKTRATPVLITADNELAAGAVAERVRLWNCAEGPAPVWA